ncbi:hypothetical protein MMC11_008744, partial [Xylographa trunciseda]|nr:hypothetical protein [Xylographa trunciseda]
CEAYWCPCILYGKNVARSEDPTLTGYSCCNGSCMGWAALACIGLQGILQCANRGNLRAQYKIEGDTCTDFLASCCCVCCALVQEDKETKDRSSQVTQQQGYQPQQKMAYEAPQQQYQPQQQQFQAQQPQQQQAYQHQASMHS